MDMWFNRNITLMGKILVVNTLVASLYVYKMSVFEMIPEQMVIKFYELVKNYLRQGKRAKINVKYLLDEKSKGGLRLVDLKSRHKALLCKWVFVSLENDFFREVAANQLVSLLGLFLWQCNLELKDVCYMVPHTSFWTHVLTAWCEYNFTPQDQIQQPLDQVLWCNSHIRIQNVPIVWEKVMQYGINHVRDLLDNRGNIMTHVRLHYK